MLFYSPYSFHVHFFESKNGYLLITATKVQLILNISNSVCIKYAKNH